MCRYSRLRPQYCIVKDPLVFSAEITHRQLALLGLRPHGLEYDRSHAMQQAMDDDRCSEVISIRDSLQRFT